MAKSAEIKMSRRKRAVKETYRECKRRGINYVELSKATGLSESGAGKIINGRTRDCRSYVALALEDFLKSLVPYEADMQVPKRNPMRKGKPAPRGKRVAELENRIMKLKLEVTRLQGSLQDMDDLAERRTARLRLQLDIERMVNEYLFEKVVGGENA